MEWINTASSEKSPDLTSSEKIVDTLMICEHVDV